MSLRTGHDHNHHGHHGHPQPTVQRTTDETLLGMSYAIPVYGGSSVLFEPVEPTYREQILEELRQCTVAIRAAIQEVALKEDQIFGKMDAKIDIILKELHRDTKKIYDQIEGIPGISDNSPFVKRILTPYDTVPISSHMGTLMTQKVNQAASAGIMSYGFPTANQNAIYLVLQAMGAASGFLLGLDYSFVNLTDQDYHNITPQIAVILTGNYDIPPFYRGVYLYTLALNVKGIILNEFSLTTFPDIHL